ncbi:MAG: hypothetical protein J6T62_09840 [Fibrobacter sp.]|nr:hypothetical protein [Fibrobacter sp.]
MEEELSSIFWLLLVSDDGSELVTVSVTLLEDFAMLDEDFFFELLEEKVSLLSEERFMVTSVEFGLLIELDDSFALSPLLCTAFLEKLDELFALLFEDVSSRLFTLVELDEDFPFTLEERFVVDEFEFSSENEESSEMDSVGLRLDASSLQDARRIVSINRGINCLSISLFLPFLYEPYSLHK